MERFDLLKNIIKTSSEARGITEYELYYSEDASISAETYRDEISAFSSSVGGMLLYRCIVDGKIGYASTEALDEAEMDALVARAAVNAACIEKDEEAIIFGGATKEDYHTVPAVQFTMPTAAVIRDEAMKCRDIIYAADKRMADGTECGAFAGQSTVRLFNSKGLDLGISVGNCGEYLQALLDNGEEKQYDYDFLYNHFGEDNREELVSIADKVVAGADAKFGAGLVKTGKYNVIFDHKQMKAMLSTFLSTFYAENAQKGLSLLKGKVGETIAADCITITDNPFYEKNPMQIPFDGEGVPTRCKNVIENGVLKTLLYNLTSAKKDGVETTGNASRSAASIGTRAYSFYINPGEMTRDELFAKAGNGIYVTEMKGFHAGANAVTGDFSIESAGFLIEDGKIGAPVKSFTVAGNFFELLKQISAIDNVLEMKAPGFSQIGSPDVLVPGMSIAGE
ncbi:MAG: TldD/PmbA family protein [Clostridia bacterium]|nr:TldD/PmbA family protein [Clostridia bacterium]